MKKLLFLAVLGAVFSVPAGACPPDAVMAERADLIVEGAFGAETAGDTAFFCVSRQLKGRCPPGLTIRLFRVRPPAAAFQLLFLKSIDRGQGVYAPESGVCGFLTHQMQGKRHQALLKTIAELPLEADRKKQEDAVEAAARKARELGYDPARMIIDIDDGNSLWNRRRLQDEQTEASLRGKEYWAVFFSPGTGVSSPALWVFVDRRFYSVIAYVRENDEGVEQKAGN